MIRYATLNSGIEGFGCGFDATGGMECVFQCEIDKDCLKVLERHYPNVKRTTDVNLDETAAELVRLRPDVVAFGSPCQDLSVAGRRGGLSAQRSGLFFRGVELCFECEAPLVVWENVSGVFSSRDGEDFASVLEAFTGFRPTVPAEGWRDSGVCIGPLYSVAWAVLDAQWFNVPQRRRRVFLVASLGDRASPYEILSLGESVPWDSPPSREAGARTADCLTAGVANGSGVNKPGRRREDDVNLVAATLETTCNDYSRADGFTMIAHALRAEGHDASDDGTGRGVPLVPIAWSERTRQGDSLIEVEPDSIFPAIKTGTQRQQGVAIAFTQNQCGDVLSGEVMHSLATNQNSTGRSAPNVMVPQMGVRRLLPVECERLMGFPDHYTRYDSRGKEISDSARYRMLGNSIVTTVAKWIGERIAVIRRETE